MVGCWLYYPLRRAVVVGVTQQPGDRQICPTLHSERFGMLSLNYSLIFTADFGKFITYLVTH